MRYRVLGATEAIDPDGDPVPLAGSRVRALLAALAARAGGRSVVPLDVLIDEVWGEAEPPADAPAALQALVGRLRRVLGKDAIVSGPGGYRLAGEDVDLLHFERLAAEGGRALEAGDHHGAAAKLREALALWRGPALADLPDHGAAGARAEALRRTALHRRIEADLRLGRARELVPELREAVAERPLDEPFRGQLIRALREAGQHADALAAYEDIRRALADELGADPGPELRALHAELLAEPSRDAPLPPRGNLRSHLTSFVGRAPDLAALRTELDAGRLVTLTGPGGSGKTRLAEEAAAAGAGAFPDGVWIAELAGLDHPGAVPGAVLSALGRRETTLMASGLEQQLEARDAMTRLLAHCAQRKLLLVLDNCEHLVVAAARLTAALLSRCPGVTVLATSREPLGVPGESVHPVEPLPPAYAHRLFAERAAAVRPGFDPSAEAEAVAEICRRLDGLPLAIELAAARLRLLTPRQIADRLDDRFRLLTSGSRTVLPRQQTLRAVVDWSWDLLDTRERTVLRRVSVFAGGWTLEAAEAVAPSTPAPPDPAPDPVPTPSDVLDILSSLVDKSLVVSLPAPPPAEGMRYRLLETIHEYATERAGEDPEALAAARHRHARHYREFARTAEPGVRSADQMAWLARVEADLDNLRAVLHRTLEQRDEDALSALIGDLGWFWWMRDYRDEGVEWIDRATALWELPSDPAHPRFGQRLDLRMLRFYLVAERISAAELESPGMRRLAQLCLDHYRPPGPHSARFPGMLWPFTAYLDQQGLHKVAAYMDEAVATCRAYGGDWEVAAMLMWRMHILIDTPGGMRRAMADMDELQAVAEQVGDRWIRAQVAAARGEISTNQRRLAAAESAFTQALELSTGLGAYTEIPFLRGRLGELALLGGDIETAEKILTQAEEEAERYSVPDAALFTHLMRALMALERGDAERARELAAWTSAHAERGTPPIMMKVVLASIDARIIALEGDPAGGLRGLRDALRTAMEGHVSEQHVAALGAAAPSMLADLDRYEDALRLLAAARAWHDPLPVPGGECRALERIEKEARQRLGERTYADLLAEGARLTPQDAMELLAG